jgi:hypothetical protein
MLIGEKYVTTILLFVSSFVPHHEYCQGKVPQVPRVTGYSPKF